ncbi:MAG: nucleoside-diphosphate kinase [Candidatus Cloacimonetes bacterium]|nr:nucleoside-diphosphate kinase [Candidatus Cloacimonadota bacterium]
MIEQTLLLIKPNAIKKKLIGDIISIIEKNGFNILKLESFYFDNALAYNFYAEHIGKEFFDRLIKFMTSGMVVAALLEKESAVEKLRELIGDTNPEKRKPGTIRYLYADSITENAVHASDTHDHAIHEIALIFPDN